MIHRLFLIVVCTVCAIGIVVTKAGAARAQRVDRGELIPQPSSWVSFTAMVTRTLPRGDSLTGRIVRGDDGSEYLVENVRDKGQMIAVRHITNYSRGMYFHSAKPGSWFSGPLQMQGERRMPAYYTKSPGLRGFPHKLALRAGQDGALNALEGLTAWLTVTDQGGVHLLAPELNFYPVVSTSVAGGRRVLSDIVVGDVERSIFEPPPGDTVDNTSEVWPPKMVK